MFVPGSSEARVQRTLCRLTSVERSVGSSDNQHNSILHVGHRRRSTSAFVRRTPFGLNKSPSSPLPFTAPTMIQNLLQNSLAPSWIESLYGQPKQRPIPFRSNESGSVNALRTRRAWDRNHLDFQYLIVVLAISLDQLNAAVLLNMGKFVKITGLASSSSPQPSSRSEHRSKDSSNRKSSGTSQLRCSTPSSDHFPSSRSPTCYSSSQ